MKTDSLPISAEQQQKQKFVTMAIHVPCQLSNLQELLDDGNVTIFSFSSNASTVKICNIHPECRCKVSFFFKLVGGVKMCLQRSPRNILCFGISLHDSITTGILVVISGAHSLLYLLTLVARHFSFDCL